MSGLQTLIAFLVALTILIFVHELGHYLVARFFDVKVLRFSIGFGKPLLRWTVGKDRTEWVLAAIPLGGYVRMLDERDSPDAPIAPELLPRAFSRKPLGQRAAIVAAGPIANFLLAIALYAALGAIGVREPAPIVDEPAAQSLAAQAGLERGDRIAAEAARPADRRPCRAARGAARRLAGHAAARSVQPVRARCRKRFPRHDRHAPGCRRGRRLGARRWRLGAAGGPAARRPAGAGHRGHRPAHKAAPDRELRLLVEREGVELALRVVPQAVAGEGPDAGTTIGRIGAALQDRVQMDTVRYGPVESLWQGATRTWDMSVFTLRMLGRMLTGELSLRNLSGPVTIADLAGQSARVGWFAYVNFMALISISLGVLNLLPIPVLDGGHLVYYALEAARGRPLSERFLELTQKAGLAVIMMMMAVALFNDITRLFGS
ncbi:MAG TPA: RIP metalloprotease RseP [Burkholderiaceae bacterium]|nr:RIP metalloprotease RseP [Burkholderiaceae bacterium]